MDAWQHNFGNPGELISHERQRSCRDEQACDFEEERKSACKDVRVSFEFEELVRNVSSHVFLSMLGIPLLCSMCIRIICSLFFLLWLHA